MATSRQSRSNRKGTKKAPATSRQSARHKQVTNNSVPDIVGVAIGALGLVLLVAVMSAQTGIVTEAIAAAMKYLFGVGAYLFPAGLILWGVSFFIPSVEIREARVAAGLSCLFVAVISLVGLASPEAAYLDSTVVSHQGGWLGGLLAWVLVKLTGPVISAIILVALCVIGLIITGLSVSELTAWIADRMSARKERRASSYERTKPVPATSVVTSNRASKKRLDDEGDASEARTVVLPGRKSSNEQTDTNQSSAGSMPIATAPTVAIGPKAMEGFELPSMSLLAKSPRTAATDVRAKDSEFRIMADTIVDALQTFDIPARVVDWITGPTVTLYKVEIAKGIRLNRVTALVDDLALAMAATTLRILAPIPGESLVGIEVPNQKRSSVTLGDILPPAGTAAPLTLGIGKDVFGEAVTCNLALLPHLLIGGTTGSGKSVALNAMLMSMLMRATPSEVRLILIDPKRVEMTLYEDVPHLYVPVVTEAKEASAALAWAVTEMDRRLRIFKKAKVRDIGSYNALLQSEDRPEWADEIPYLVIVIDELADLMMVAAKEVEESIVRLSQLARAAGIHLIVATQRPEANVVTGLIKANITNRIAFNVASGIDSKVILDTSGAEKLTGLGDMLFSIPSWPKPKRIQGCFVSSEEVAAVVAALKEQGEPDYHREVLETNKQTSIGGGAGGADDPLLWDAAEMVVSTGVGSTSAIQRRFRVGYARAGRIMDMLFDKGIVGPADGSKPREVLVSLDELELMMGSNDTENEEF